jgi:hypothetical protein
LHSVDPAPSTAGIILVDGAHRLGQEHGRCSACSRAVYRTRDPRS